jgi:hypothetical protein
MTPKYFLILGVIFNGTGSVLNNWLSPFRNPPTWMGMKRHEVFSRGRNLMFRM